MSCPALQPGRRPSHETCACGGAAPAAGTLQSCSHNALRSWRAVTSHAAHRCTLVQRSGTCRGWGAGRRAGRAPRPAAAPRASGLRPGCPAARPAARPAPARPRAPPRRPPRRRARPHAPAPPPPRGPAVRRPATSAVPDSSSSARLRRALVPPTLQRLRLCAAPSSSSILFQIHSSAHILLSCSSFSTSMRPCRPRAPAPPPLSRARLGALWFPSCSSSSSCARPCCARASSLPPQLCQTLPDFSYPHTPAPLALHGPVLFNYVLPRSIALSFFHASARQPPHGPAAHAALRCWFISAKHERAFVPCELQPPTRTGQAARARGGGRRRASRARRPSVAASPRSSASSSPLLAASQSAAPAPKPKSSGASAAAAAFCRRSASATSSASASSSSACAAAAVRPQAGSARQKGAAAALRAFHIALTDRTAQGHGGDCWPE